jgi:pyruvate decarboxylase
MSVYDGPAGEISLGAYIFYRLRSVGIHHVFGCPGDFNLNFLDHLSTVPSLNWVGTCNELNAAYAADGYCRTRGLPGALVTTYGVGELSAINGVAGAYSEHVPIIHIVGTTSRLAQKDRVMIHHTLGEKWDHTTFQRMSEPVRAASAFLMTDHNFTEEVDRIIETSFKTRRPVYLFIPMDTPDILVDPARLSKPLDLDVMSSCSESVEDEVVEFILQSLETAKNPAILLDVLANRYGVASEAQDLVRKTHIPVSLGCCRSWGNMLRLLDVHYTIVKEYPG